MPSSVRQALVRVWPWWLSALVLFAGLVALRPAEAQIVAYKACLVTFAIVLGYWADRALFSHVTPVTPMLPRDVYGAARLIARALIVVGIVIGFTVGI